jgi:HSP20 family protein
MFANLLKREDAKPLAAKQEPAARPAPTRVPEVAVRETDQAIEVTALMPGVSAERVQVNLNDGRLTVRGAVAVPATAGLQQLLGEFAPVDFERTFAVPTEVDATQISASARHGVLTLTLPKASAAQPRRIAVRSG